MNEAKPMLRVIETRDITYEKKSIFFGLITWRVEMCATHIANDIILILKTPIRKIMIDNNGKIQEINLEISSPSPATGKTIETPIKGEGEI